VQNEFLASLVIRYHYSDTSKALLEE